MSLKFGDAGAEKLTAELEQRAAAEADSLLAADGTICLERLALMRKTFDPGFVARVLSRSTFSALLSLPEQEWDADAMNTAMLLEDFREIRQWQEAPPTARAVYPERLLSAFRISETSPFSNIESAMDTLKAALAPQPFMEAHPKMEEKLPAKPRMRRRRGAAAASSAEEAGREPLPDLSQFRSLLRSFSGGTLEGAPLGKDRLLVAGSAMAWCMRPLDGRLRSMCLMETLSHKVEKALLAKLTSKLGQRFASRILWMAQSAPGEVKFKVSDPAVSTVAYRSRILQEAKGEAWQDADLDLFMLADGVQETLAETVDVVRSNIASLTGGLREAVLVRTKNTLTISGGHPFPNIQVVVKTVRSCQELLVHADVDCTAMAYDGTEVWTTFRALRAAATGYNFIPKLLLTGFGPRVARSLARFNKYYRRGFGLLVFEHCRHAPRCDHSVPSGAFQRLQKYRVPVEPRSVQGTPEEKGEALAKWMLSAAPDLQRKAARSAGGAGAAAVREALGEGDPLSERLVPGDRLSVAGLPAAPAREGRGEGARGAPFRRYNEVTEVVIPCGPDVCAQTLREYVQRLGCPNLLTVVASVHDGVAAVAKDSSDRASWQDKSRGKCYMCKLAVVTKAPWPMCDGCKDFCQRKREMTADLTGKVALVTGGRVKIGRASALRLLRLGATVVLTTRFPRNALEAFEKEPDFEAFAPRLTVLAADFRRLPSVQQVVDTVLDKFDRLDILIHNAAQTVRRPPAYYESLIKKEEELSGAVCVSGGSSPDRSTGPCTLVEEALALLPAHGQLPLLPSDHEAERLKAELFPAGRTDAHGDQLDLRTVTSWTMKLEDTELPELAEVLAVNLVVPYLLTARFLPLLRKSSAAFVVFVSSQEGSFSAPSGHKHSQHPHTNVAKAGLNMLARTIAGDLRRDAIFASAVDPGWVSWMKPGGSQAAERAPLSEEDGAARVLDPVLSGLLALKSWRSPPSGVFFKDFRVAPW